MASSFPSSPICFMDLPYDILPHILHQLIDRTDWYHAALVSLTWNRAATPFLYETVDSKISKGVLIHPATTILERPELAQHVRNVTETGTVHGVLLPRYPSITSDTLRALALCTGLRSVTWVDDASTPQEVLLGFLTVLERLPLRSITIRTHNDLGPAIWARLSQLTGIERISVWSMQGPPRVLQDWVGVLGSTLTHLELGRVQGIPPTVLITVLSQLPKLKALRLKGAPSAAIPSILTYLPNLTTLDTEYLGAGNYRKPDKPLPKIRRLTIRTSSMSSMQDKLWSWILQLLPLPSLETFTLNAFSMQGDTSIPRGFIMDLAAIHGNSLRHFELGSTQLTLEDIECMCCKFPNLELLVASVASVDLAYIVHAIKQAVHLITLRLDVTWFHAGLRNAPFTIQDATRMMLRDEQSQLRVIGMGKNVYTGKWVLGEHGEREFSVRMDIAGDKWYS